jgi:hypothetical protein
MPAFVTTAPFGSILGISAPQTGSKPVMGWRCGERE